MNFTSQICTTKVQSEQLLALGLKKETADMELHFFKDKVNKIYETACASKGYMEPEMAYLVDCFPAWSLHRLIEMYSEHYVCEHINLKLLTYDTIIENIRLDILTGTFNKEYLEE